MNVRLLLRFEVNIVLRQLMQKAASFSEVFKTIYLNTSTSLCRPICLFNVPSVSHRCFKMGPSWRHFDAYTAAALMNRYHSKRTSISDKTALSTTKIFRRRARRPPEIHYTRTDGQHSSTPRVVTLRLLSGRAKIPMFEKSAIVFVVVRVYIDCTCRRTGHSADLILHCLSGSARPRFRVPICTASPCVDASCMQLSACR